MKNPIPDKAYRPITYEAHNPIPKPLNAMVIGTNKTPNTENASIKAARRNIKSAVKQEQNTENADISFLVDKFVRKRKSNIFLVSFSILLDDTAPT
ncbi:MAG: hypothetical protein KBS62_07975 [Oscillospiraceae bacterium]|nr:hypothetical protein [Candidatus Ruminococcus equi]